MRRFLYSRLLGLLEFECEWCLLLLFFSFCVSSVTNLFIISNKPEWLCATRFNDDVIFLSFRYGGLYDIVHFCRSWMSEEQLFVFGTFFLGKEMIRVQINYSYEISRSTVMNHWVRQQQKYGVQDYTFGQWSILESCTTIIMNYRSILKYRSQNQYIP